ncbi:MAG: four helix bundle protein [Clostridiales bacterium]|nr:four helix bundle protein [Clostridiales bacterium]
MEQNDYSVKDFKTLKVWQKARELAQDIYLITANFPQFETYAIKSQIIRAAATSIGANIAEGNGQLYKKKQINFLNNALGSASETRHWLVIAADNGYISQEDYDKLEEKTVEIIKMLISFIREITG